MIIGYTALLSALLISGVAIYFSIQGLAATFSASADSVKLMGGVIELGKLAGILWLHYNWDHARAWLRIGMFAMIVSVMFLTAIGSYGWLSKAHTEQTLASDQREAKIAQIDAVISRNQRVILRAEQKIEKTRIHGSGADLSLQNQIDKVQGRLDKSYTRVNLELGILETKLTSQTTALEDRTAPYTKELSILSDKLRELRQALDNNNIKKAQRLVGTKPDGIYKKNTVAAVNLFRGTIADRQQFLLLKIDNIRASPSQEMIITQASITRLRAGLAKETSASMQLTARLQAKIGESDAEVVIDTAQRKVTELTLKNDSLYADKFKLESGFRKLKAELGPVKYIAEFIYGSKADQHLLEKAVQWVIILIIVVFDPFAVFLLIAAQHSFIRAKKRTVTNKITPTTPEVDLVTESSTTTIIEPQIDVEEINQEIDEVLAKQAVTLVKVGQDHINFNGKVYHKDALQSAFPDMKLDIDSPVSFGNSFPTDPAIGKMFIISLPVPTQLCRFNGIGWDKIDKNLLSETAFSTEYIESLITLIGAGKYNTELLSNAERYHIEQLYSKD